MDAIYHRRAVREYAPEKINEAVIRKLLDAAVHAPTAIHEEPWAFAIIQDQALLKRLSDNVKELMVSGAVETLIALTFVLTVDDPNRFPRSQT
jgi:nitroreductase